MNDFTDKIPEKLQGSIKSRLDLSILSSMINQFKAIIITKTKEQIKNTIQGRSGSWKDSEINQKVVDFLTITLSPTSGDSLPTTISVNSKLIKALSSIIFKSPGHLEESFKFDSRWGGMVPWNLQLSLLKNIYKTDL